MRDYIAWLASSLFEKGLEIPVTLVVSGKLVSGYVTSPLRFQKWSTEVIRRAQLAGGTYDVPDAEMQPLTESEKAELKTIAEAARSKLSGQEMLEGEIEDPDLSEMMPILHLRNVFIEGIGREMPYVAVQTDRIDALTIGHLEVPRVG